MIYSNINKQTLGFLGRALSLEFTAVQNYTTISHLLKARGFEGLAEKFQQEAKGEMTHVERIIGKMLIMGVVPNATQLRPAIIGNSLPEVFANAKKFEIEIVEFYQKAVTHCSEIGDFDSHVFFSDLLKEEQAHKNLFESWKVNYSGVLN